MTSPVWCDFSLGDSLRDLPFLDQIGQCHLLSRLSSALGGPRGDLHILVQKTQAACPQFTSHRGLFVIFLVRPKNSGGTTDLWWSLISSLIGKNSDGGLGCWSPTVDPEGKVWWAQDPLTHAHYVTVQSTVMACRLPMCLTRSPGTVLNESCSLTGRMEMGRGEISAIVRRIASRGPGVHLLGIIKLVVAHCSHSPRAVKPESGGL